MEDFENYGFGKMRMSNLQYQIEDIKYLVLYFILIILLGCTNSNPEKPPVLETQIAEDITSNTTWESIHNPYIITNDITIRRGVVLTIKPSVEIRFDGFYRLTVEGTLIANGMDSQTSSVNPIIFTPNKSVPDFEDWQGIKFNNTNENESILRYAKIEYAKIAVDIFSSLLQLSDCVIENNNMGIQIFSSPAIVKHNLISNNKIGIKVIPARSQSTISQNTITANEEGIIVTETPVIIKENNLVYNLGYDMSFTKRFPNFILPAADNWWGSTNADEIEKKIYDHLDNSNVGRIKYVPFANSEITDAGPRYNSGNFEK